MVLCSVKAATADFLLAGLEYQKIKAATANFLLVGLQYPRNSALLQVQNRLGWIILHPPHYAPYLSHGTTDRQHLFRQARCHATFASASSR